MAKQPTAHAQVLIINNSAQLLNTQVLQLIEHVRGLFQANTGDAVSVLKARQKGQQPHQGREKLLQ